MVTVFDFFRGSARRERREDGRFCDVGVPEFVEAQYAKLLVLGLAESRRYNGAYLVEVQCPGREPYRATIRSGTNPSSIRSLVLGFHAPGLIDCAHPSRVALLEPPCGPNLPMVEPLVQKNRDARDLRTSELLLRYPPPATAQLFEMMRPTASAVHPLWDALRFRMGLMTTLEAEAVLDRIRGDGNAWQETLVTLNPGWHLPSSDFFTTQAECLGHLARVAPAGGAIDEQPLMSIGLAVLLRELRPEAVDMALFDRLVRPFVEVCGPIDEASV